MIKLSLMKKGYGPLKRFLKKSGIKNFIIFCFCIGIISISIFIFWISTFQLPTLDSFQERRVSQSTKIYDRTGEILLYDVFQNIKRTVVPFDQISKHIKNATLSIEDKDFYTHSGVKPSSFLRAVFANLKTQQFSQGGSTITQQVVKNSLLTGEKSITRKVKEWVLAIKLEKILTKDQIFSMYLNEIPYGGSIYGVEEASNAFFGKKASDVTIAESAYLASLPKAPTYYSPYRNRPALDERKNLVLKEMLEDKYITQEEYEKAKNEVVIFKPQEDGKIKAPHFVMFVKDLLEKKYGVGVLEEGGFKVITTLDYKMQEMMEEEAKKYALDNAKNHQAENIAVVAIDPKTGEILSMVGSRDYFDKEIDGNFNVATAHRQPGSAFKPFAYATAFMKGYTPETALFDVRTQFSTTCEKDDMTSIDGCYSPQNYDGKFRGPMSMRDALGQSINIPAIKTLYLAGVKDVLRLAKDMGITSLANADEYGLTLVLGGGEVSLLDMTSAYGVFANSGVRYPYQPILEVQKKDGGVVEKKESNPTTVLPEDVALQISDILSDDNARAPIFGVHSHLYIPNRQVAVKTGTTNDYKDAWIVGYTPSLVVGAWVGNNNNTSMDKKVAGYIIAPFWNTVMKKALENYPNETFKKPYEQDLTDLKPIFRGGWQGGTSYGIDKISGKLATEYTPKETLEEIVVGEPHSILYWVDKDNPRGPQPTNPKNDPQYEKWEYSVQKWLDENNIKTLDESDIPTGFDDVHVPEKIPEISIEKPEENKEYAGNQKINVIIEYIKHYPITKVEYYINGNFVGSNTASPFTFSFVPDDINYINDGNNTLKAVIYDSVFNKNEDTINFRIKK
ncbi:MAG: penicillin-binding protein [Candidatus Paceibacterota bacterium]